MGSSYRKFYGVDILVSNSTYDAIHTQGIICRKIDRIRVKGQNAVVEVYELLGFDSDIDENIQEDLILHHQAIDSYYAGRWSESRDIFLRLKEKENLSTRICNIYLERIESLDGKIEVKNWDGVYSHESK